MCQYDIQANAGNATTAAKVLASGDMHRQQGYDAEAERRVVRKLDMRVVPLLAALSVSQTLLGNQAAS
jgi:hypothetical protein